VRGNATVRSDGDGCPPAAVRQIAMIELWIPVTFTAALFQTWRTALQQRLRSQLSVNAAGFVRYLYAIPAGLVLVAVSHAATGQALPEPGATFLVWCAAGGLMQIFGTSLLIMAFGYRNFAVGTAYAKTEAVQGAVAAWLILGEVLTPVSIAGIGIGVSGVLLLSLGGRGLKGRELLAATLQPAALCGLGAGLFAALASVFIKEATLALPGDRAAPRALFTLLSTNLLQTLMMGGWLALRERDQLLASFTSWRSSVWVGTLSACGSGCWFTGFALAPVALVRAVGQIEMVFTLVFSRFYLKEQIRRVDVAGLLLVVGGVLLVLAGR
jgi:drug/metabolite transporter (DMT)-like permease